MEFVPNGLINNNPALVQIMTWRCTGDKPLSEANRTTRMPVFWGYPLLPHDYPYYWVILDPKSKEDKVKVKEFTKISNVWNLKQILHTTHLLKLLVKMWKYEMDPTSILEDTERTRFCPQTDRRTDGWTDRWTDGQGETCIPPFQLRWSGGYNDGLVSWCIYASLSLNEFII